ncbi:SDR family oxidoreductase [Streptomyces luteolus]|uniref:SDR family oxidoreductase n=1 Tax=Streptomyces luteolus TaxID=3043615 RepID=A0ABT6SPU3_9ACTN|nr:SDR family oxidoreductase [Streptomyces sp. B-S-A12]MDI3417611.1 SDR family oxidoreductase [Streptomyces sp. B-S-A12]
MFAGKTALVTGASKGIGYAIAEALVAKGAHVVLTARKEQPLAEAAARLGAPGRVLAVPGNSSDEAHRADAVAQSVARFGSLDLLVNNTGINPLFEPLARTDLRTVGKVFDTNVVASLGWVQQAWDASMSEHGGSILNMASVAGLRPAPMMGIYAASKAALVHLTAQLATELCPGVRVNAIAPAVVRTDFARPLFEGNEEKTAAQYPLGRLGSPADIARAATFLLSADADWITGQTLIVDGGLLLGGGVA